MNTRDQDPMTPEERDLAQRLSRLGGHAQPSPALDAKILAAAAAAASGSPAASATPARPPLRHRRRPRVLWPMGMGVAASLVVALGVAWQLRPQHEMPVLRAEAPHAVSMVEPPASHRPVPRVQADAAAAPDAAVGARRAPPLDADAAPAEAPAAASVQALEPMPPQPDREIVFDAPSPMDVPAPAPPPPPPPAPPAPIQAPAIAADPGVEAVRRATAAEAESATAVGVDAHRARAERLERSRRDASLKALAPAAGAAAPARQDSGARETLDAIVVGGSRVDEASRDADAYEYRADDQPDDDQPPATADSPAIRNAWLLRVRELRDAGQRRDARDSLREFVRRHPDADVPVDLRPLLEE